jgi:hypothetical protein
MVRRRDGDLYGELAAADALIGTLVAAVVDDVGVVLGQPINIRAVRTCW